ncbi:response regulator [Gilvimarinus xylanilyticus]|uniref:histidine kinase n=1 Tax=Gilvimarinus xylanilyticus TaxID=2944139 RepID=A0A9X2I553_9GAMM|nr:PAS domain-containing hybrid sensor histidine kinase/response regulator [Gilvimarinus xylanilyticus]MCP8899632.1 response regulator [Gilvimarinus xylanilyticus]
MAKDPNNKDLNTLEARNADLEQALAERSDEPAYGELQPHLELLQGDLKPANLTLSLELLSAQLQLSGLTLWRLSSRDQWHVLASQSEHLQPPAKNQLLPPAGETLDASSGSGQLLALYQDQRPIAVWQLPETPLLPRARKLLEAVGRTMHDAAARMLANQRLAENEERYQHIIAAAQPNLWEWNTQTDQVHFNQHYLALLGYESRERAGNLQTLAQYFLHPEDARNVLDQLRQGLRQQCRELNLEHRLQHRDGRVLWARCHCLFTGFDESGRATHCYAYSTDITEHIEDKHQVLETHARAEAASNAKAKFMASMSHEIRTPMNAIIGLSHLLQDTQLSTLQESYLNSIHSAADSLLQTVNQVFDYAKLESHKVLLEHSHFDLEQVLERVARLFEDSSLHNHARITFDIADDVPRFMRGDATRLSHIISQLMRLALQHPDSDRLTFLAHLVDAQNDSLCLRFSVIDYTTGLSKSDLTALKAELKQPQLIDPHNDIAFGLHICNRLVQLMHGELNVASSVDEGTIFSFTANLEKSHIGAQRIQQNADACKALKLLVVDDNQLALDILTKSANKLIDHVDAALDAHSALGKIERAEKDKKPYDLVLIDYKMPLKNGLETAREIKCSTQLHQKPKIFLVSSFQRDEIFTQYSDTEYVDDFLNKPVSDSRLLDAIFRALPQHAQSSDNANRLNEFPALNGRQMLLVEDNMVNQQVARGLLRKAGIVVTSADNGQQALDILAEREQPFDAILMDIEMPVLDGISATQKIRRMPTFAATPIIAVTAQAMSGDRQSCLNAGMNEYLSKPLKPQELYQTLNDLLSSTQAPATALSLPPQSRD